jgi:apolipoprotein D and lipocalin family protein
LCVGGCIILRRIYHLLVVSLTLAGCTQLPEGIEPVEGLEINRYLGKWYEIARLDNRFEKGLNNVTAQYTLRSDGGIEVINSGYSARNNEWTSAQGKAYFAGEKGKGHLKVSFFGPFYSSYVIFELDKTGYQYAFVCGYNRNYLWLLARQPRIHKGVIEHFLDKAKSLGFAADEIIFVAQDREDAQQPDR